MVGSIIYTLPDIRSAYSLIPAASLFLYLFSGLIFKPSTLPQWLAPWLPSVSIIRWYSQGMFINQFIGNEVALPTLSGPEKYSTYESVLNTFGWGGKTKWDCFGYVFLNFIIFRILKLVVSLKTVTAQTGRRGLRKKVYVERMF
jgi:hypothetical protein